MDYTAKFLQLRFLEIDGAECAAGYIAIEDCPPGYHREQLLKLVRSGAACIWAVAILGDANDWAAYYGHPEPGAWTDEAAPHMKPYVYQALYSIEGTAAFGDKMSVEEARALFPWYADRHYRA